MATLIQDRSPTFIQIAEIWVPDGDSLALAASDHADLEAFAASSRPERFAKGEGLPGRAWEKGRPIVLSRLDEATFRRHVEAREAGLCAAVAIPVFAANQLKAVLVLLCSEDPTHVGAIEVWEEEAGKLGLADGYYGTAAGFEAVSRGTQFAIGEGLPGGVWASQTPILMRDLGSAYGFVRSSSASAIGLTTGIGLPTPSPTGARLVTTLLSAASTPIATRFEIWDARPERVGPQRKAVRVDGICPIEGPLWPRENPPVDMVSAQAWQGPIGQVLGTGLPHIVADGTGLPSGYRRMIALPIYHESELAYVVAWYL